MEKLDKSVIMTEGKAWLVWTQTDLTEGKGASYVKHVCETEATARRLAKGGYVQGSNCPIEKGKIFQIRGGTRRFTQPWYAPCRVLGSTQEDLNEQERLDKINAAIKAAEGAGLTSEQIATLRG